MKRDAIGTTQHSSDDTARSSVSSASGFAATWSSLITHYLHAPVLKGLHGITQRSAKHPKSTIACVVFLALGLFGVGILTNFNVNVDENVIWVPMDSHPVRHREWIEDDSGFPRAPQTFLMVLHSDGSEVMLGRDDVRAIFKAVDTVRDLPGYASVCEPYGCNVTSVTKFFNNDAALFEESALTDEDVMAAMSAKTYPDGTPVADRELFGTPVRNNETGLLISAKSYSISIAFPNDDDSDDSDDEESFDFEKEALDTIFDLADEWEETDSSLQLEVFSDRSFADEFGRSILRDLPLLPTVFVIMGIFTSAIFFNRDKVLSRSLLGFTAVIAVLLSILGGYGLVFICGVPFTSMTQILPFVFFGVGLNNSFIITGSFFRLDHITDPVERVRAVVGDIGMSIFLTTLTSSLAFALGCVSSIPAILWLCIYAVPTMIANLVVQLTFFIACIVLDELRIQAGNRDCFRCLSCRLETNKEETNEEAEEDETKAETSQETAADRFMEFYAYMLLQPAVQALVVVSFLALSIVCVISTTKLKQAFEFTDVLPNDSYVIPFLDAVDDYSDSSSVVAEAYFRNVDQSDPLIQDAMDDYINELVSIDAIADQPAFFWLRDFKTFASGRNFTDFPFVEQLDLFLEDPVYSELYAESIVRDSRGEVTASRCTVFMDNVDIENVNNQIDALKDQRKVSKDHPVNKDFQDDFRFFLYGQEYGIWEFYSISASEIVATTVLSMIVVTVVSLVLVPHWTAALFVLPMICILYVDLLGVLQWAGESINPVSYIALVMSVGLLVDFILHVLFRYYEASGTRREKTIEMLKTMGSSILIGGVTTFLGTLPLALSTSSIFGTIFVAFVGLVLLGSTHGLMLLPVILSLIGPEDDIAHVNPDVPKTVGNDNGLVEPLEESTALEVCA